MSNSRQRAPALRSASVGFSSGYHWRSRRSGWGELIWASRGVVSVTVQGAIWVVAPPDAVWMPPNVAHDVRMAGRGTLRLVYLSPHTSRRLPRHPTVVQVSPLLRELLRRAIDRGTLSRARAAESRILALILDEIVAVPVAPLQLPMPTDARARRAAEAMRADPASALDLVRIGRMAGASVRTLERRFREETGLSLGAWRNQARLVHAMMRLAEGESVTRTAFSVGYASTSAFVAAFKRAVGVTPGKFA